MTDSLFRILAAACLLAPGLGGVASEADPTPQKAEMAGSLLVPHERVDTSFNAGFSMYVAAWPLLRNYPGQDFQSGLFGTWMFAQYDGKKPEKIYSDVEGGLGWWRDTRFATETPKFIMGGVALNFVEWANGPGAGKGRDWKNPKGHYAIAQLSPSQREFEHRQWQILENWWHSWPGRETPVDPHPGTRPR